MQHRLVTAAGEGDPEKGWPEKAPTAAQHLRDVFHRMGLDVSAPLPLMMCRDKSLVI